MPSAFWHNGKPGPKILTLDIETGPINASVWSLWDQRIGLEQITQDWFIMGYGAKWLGQEVFYNDVFSGKNRSDEHLCRQLRDLMDAADIIVTQNGKRFDIRKINARLLAHGMHPPSPFKQVDTKQESSKLSMQTSNKLEYLAPVVAGTFKEKHQKFPGYTLWKECLAGNLEAQHEMRTYCMQDVEATEKLYLALRPWITGHPNVALYYHDDVTRCPKCGSEDLEAVGQVYTQVGKYESYRCDSCGGFSRGRYQKLSKDKLKGLLTC